MRQSQQPQAQMPFLIQYPSSLQQQQQDHQQQFYQFLQLDQMLQQHQYLQQKLQLDESNQRIEEQLQKQFQSSRSEISQILPVEQSRIEEPAIISPESDQELLALSTQIMQTQNKILESLSNFPRINPESIAVKPIEVLSMLLKQIDFLFEAYQESHDANLDNEYSQMMNEKATADCNMLRLQLQKQEDQLKNTRTEKEYYQKQVDYLRKETESLKMHNKQLELNLNQVQLFDQMPRDPSTLPPLSYSSFGEPSAKQRSSSQSHNTSTHSSASFNPSLQPPLYQSHTNTQGQSQSKNQSYQQAMFQLQASEKQIEALQQEIKDLQFELQQRADALCIKQDNALSIQSQLETLKAKAQQDQERLKQQIAQKEEVIQAKDAVLQKLQSTCEELIAAHSIEIPLGSYSNDRSNPSSFPLDHSQVVRKKEIASNLSKSERKQQSSSGSRQQAQPKSAFKSKLQFMKDIYEEAQQFLDDGLVTGSSLGGMGAGQEEMLRIPSLSNIAKPVKKKTLQFVHEPMLAIGATQLIDLNETVLNQIQAAKVAEEALLNMKKDELQNLSEFEKVNMHYKELKDKITLIVQQRQEHQENLQQVQRENDQIKQKFATLLDQFQEYVNLSEERQFQEENQLRIQQEQMIAELTNSVQDLEQHVNAYQIELQQKEEIYQLLKVDFSRLEAKHEEQERIHSQRVGQLERSKEKLEEELNYMKKHTEVELGLMKDENEILKRELREANARRLLEQNQFILSQNPARRRQQDYSKSPTRDASFYQNEEIAECREAMSPQKSQSMANLKARNFLINHQDQSMTNTTMSQAHLDRMRKEIMDKERVIEDKNQEILKLRIAVEDMQATSQSQTHYQAERFSPELQIQKSNILYDLGIALGKLRQELSKSKSLLCKDPHQAQQLYERFESNAVVVKQSSQQYKDEEFIREMHQYIYEIRQLVSFAGEIALLHQFELERSNQRPASQIPHLQNTQTQHFSSNVTGLAHAPTMNILDQNYQAKRQADNHLKNGQVQQLYEQLMNQICKVESLMQDNAILQRQIHKYESTLSELDEVLRETENGNVILDLKRIAENQLKEIVSLQREVEIVKFNGQAPPSQFTQASQQPQLQQYLQNQKALEEQDQIISQLKRQLEDSQYMQTKHSQVMAENQELMGERKTLLQLCEDLEKQVKEGHRSLDEALEKIVQTERDNEVKQAQLEFIRTRITEVAELFEKKEIKQKYSFEVLCDFIFDKAKRLFVKYENALKDSKGDKSSTHHQRRMGELEKENEDIRSSLINVSFQVQDASQRLVRLLNLNPQQQFDLSYLMDQLERISLEMTQENFMLKSKVQESSQGLNMNQRGQMVVYGTQGQSEEQLRMMIEQLRNDKEKLVDRNSDLALALKDMTEDYKRQKEDNEKIKERLYLYERCGTSSQMHNSIMFTPVRNTSSNQLNSVVPPSGQAQPLNDSTNRSAGPLENSITQNPSSKINQVQMKQTQFDYTPQSENLQFSHSRDATLTQDKFHLLGQKILNSHNSNAKQQTMLIKDMNQEGSAAGVIANQFNYTMNQRVAQHAGLTQKLSSKVSASSQIKSSQKKEAIEGSQKPNYEQNDECNTSQHLTDEDDDMPLSKGRRESKSQGKRRMNSNNGLHTSNQIYSEKKRGLQLSNHQDFY